MKALLIGLSTTLVACSTPGDYYAAAVQQEQLRTAAMSDMATAMLQISRDDPTARGAAIMALALQAQSRGAPIQPVQSEALQWASVVAPVLGMGLQAHYGYKLGVVQSNNSTRLGINTNQTFGQFASEINSPTVVMQPPPLVVTQPPPVIVPTPDPIIVEPSYPPITP